MAVSTEEQRARAGRPEPEEAVRPVHLGYLAPLDGLRAVAVLAVVVYHGHPSWLPGGFLGVDVFFVISGFLITTLLVREHEATGRIDLLAFWLRRARRLLPPIVLVVAAVGLYALLVQPESVERIRQDGLSTLLYLNNWSQVQEGSSYFDAFTEPSPLRHAWSLAIEEQFYLVWPLVLVGLLRCVHGRVRALVPIVLVGALASALLMSLLAGPSGDPTRAYYGTDTRAQGLLVGAALAFLLHGRRLGPRASAFAGLVGVVGLAGLLVMFLLVGDLDLWMYDGGFLLAALLAAAAVTAAAVPLSPTGPRNLAGLALAVPPLPALGRISYGIYLWHWPVDVVLDADLAGFDGVALFALQSTVTLALAAASYRLVERPIRAGTLRPPQLLGGLAVAGVATAVPLVLAGAGSESEEGREQAVVKAGTGDLEVLVVGDSVAAGLVGSLPDDAGEEVTVHNAALLGCGITSGIPQPVQPLGPQRADRCDVRLDAWEREVEEHDPDVAVLFTGGHEVFAQQVGDVVLQPGTPEFAAFYREELARDVEVLSREGARVLIVTGHCMAEEAFLGDGQPERNDVARVQWLNEQVRAVANAEGAGVEVADLFSRVCPGDEHVDELDGVQLYRDGVHFTEAGGALVWRWLVDELPAAPGS